jgi:hypothetical protein
MYLLQSVVDVQTKLTKHFVLSKNRPTIIIFLDKNRPPTDPPDFGVGVGERPHKSLKSSQIVVPELCLTHDVRMTTLIFSPKTGPFSIC